jgi:hypothetical protein
VIDILSGITAVSETLKITKELRSIDDKVAVADLKLRLSDVVDGLLEAKEALQDANERERDLKAEIEQLKAQRDLKERLEDDNGLLFKVDQERNRIGEPYCNHCYADSGKLFRLIRRNDSFGFAYRCTSCGQGFGSFARETIESDWDPFDR